MEIRANERDAKNKFPIQTRECAHRYLFRSKFVLAKRREEREKKNVPLLHALLLFSCSSKKR